MARVVGPILSFRAAGSVGKSVTYQSRARRPSAAPYTIPADPRSAGQIAQRQLVTWLSKLWEQSPSGFQDPWTALTVLRPRSPIATMIGANSSALQGATDLSAFVFGQPSNGGYPCSSATFTAIAGGVRFAGTFNSNVVGYDVVAVLCLALLDQNPRGAVIEAAHANYVTGASTSFTFNMRGLQSHKLYRCAAILGTQAANKYSVAFFSLGAPLTGSATPL